MEYFKLFKALYKLTLLALVLISFNSCALFHSSVQTELDASNAEKDQIGKPEAKQIYNEKMSMDELADFLNLTNAQKNAFVNMTEEYRISNSTIIADKTVGYEDKQAQMATLKESYLSSIEELFDKKQFAKYKDHFQKPGNVKQSKPTF